MMTGVMKPHPPISQSLDTAKATIDNDLCLKGVFSSSNFFHYTIAHWMLKEACKNILLLCKKKYTNKYKSIIQKCIQIFM